MSARTARVAVLALSALLALGPGHLADARAESGAEVRELARRAAAGDGDALATLRAVREVDGAPVDLRAALDAPRRQRQERLRSLAGASGADAPGEVSGASEAAAGILEDGRFHESSVPRPFRRLLEWLGDRLEPVRGPLVRFVRSLPGGPMAGWLALAAVIALVAVLVASRLARRRGAVVSDRSAAVKTGSREDPGALERAAAEAERDGDFERAVRYRFRAGVLRLARAGVLPPGAELTTGELRRRLAHSDFDGIAETFDQVAYGGREATAADARAAGDGWPRVLDEARR